MADDGSILVTGAAGQLGAVGRTVTEMLLDRGLPVRAMVRREAKEQGHIINLMDALRASVAKTQDKGTETGKPAKKMAPSKGKEPAARKRKTS